MAQNFVACDREQVLLLPPSLREWLPEDHLAWLVLEAAGELDLTAFYVAYRADGHGRAALDHATIARFRARHEIAIGELFGQVLALCARAGLVRLGVVAVDGTKIAANATHHATRSYEQIAREILEEAAALDAAEDERCGDARGDELPVELRVAGDRRKRLREAKQALDAEREADAEPVARDRGQRLRECRRRLEQDYE